MILLSGEDIQKALPMDAAIAAMRRGFVSLSAGDATVPLRTFIPLDSHGGSALFMPAYAEAEKAYAVKIASIHKGNASIGMDAVQAFVALFDAGTGRVLALMEGKSITAIRTGAGSGLATDLMARDDASVAFIMGSGVQAKSHLEAVCAVRSIKRAFCVSRSKARREAFAEEMSASLGVEVIATQDLTMAATAEVICTTTTATEPILFRSQVSAGTHINAVGTHRPTDAEIDPQIVADARVVVDQLEGCLAEAGDVIRPLEAGVIDQAHIIGELGEVAAGEKSGRESNDEITLFKSVGNAIQDLVAATTAYENAKQMGLGRTIQL